VGWPVQRDRTTNPCMTIDLNAHAEVGPNAVGIKTFELRNAQTSDRTLPVDVWYPAQASSDYDAHPEAAHPLNVPHRAQEGLPPAQGSFPLVVFSHGNSGYGRQTTSLMTHLASHGIAVAAPDHVGNTFLDSLKIDNEEDRKRVHFEARDHRPRDIHAVTDAVLAGIEGVANFDPGAVAVMGHSYGGWTSCKMPGIDSRIRAVCGLAPATEAFVGRKAFDEGELPFSGGQPTLLIAGTDDVLVDTETSVAKLFDRLGTPRALVGIDGADHFHFCDAIPMLHGLHEANKRPAQTRPTRPYEDLLEESRMQRVLGAIVTSFFKGVFDAGTDDPTAHLTSESLTRLDPAAIRLK
jgi:predicted dienelactone hydrolase